MLQPRGSAAELAGRSHLLQGPKGNHSINPRGGKGISAPNAHSLGVLPPFLPPLQPWGAAGRAGGCSMDATWEIAKLRTALEPGQLQP